MQLLLFPLHVVFLGGVFCSICVLLLFSGVILFPLWYTFACKVESDIMLWFYRYFWELHNCIILTGSSILGYHHKLFARGVQSKNLGYTSTKNRRWVQLVFSLEQLPAICCYEILWPWVEPITVVHTSYHQSRYVNIVIPTRLIFRLLKVGWF